MQVSTMRLADRLLGVPACLLFTLVRRILDAGLPDEPVKPKKILFVKLVEQGSTVLAYPAFRRAVEMVGRENVYFLVFDENRFIMDVMGVIPENNVIAIRNHSMSIAVRDALRAIRRMRDEQIDTAIDLEFFARSSAAMTFLSGARWRVGFHAFHGEAAYRGDLMTHRLLFNPQLHTSHVFMSLIESLMVPPKQLPTFDHDPFTGSMEPPRITPDESQVSAVSEIICREAGTDSVPPLFLLNANCSDLLPLRRWPTPNYIDLAKRLLERYPDARVALTGAPDEAPAAEDLVRQVGSSRCISLAGKTTLKQLMVLYSLSQVLVTNDSGPAHFAALTPIDVVVLFGPETPRLFGALTPRNHVFWAGIPCSPCVNAFNDRLSPCKNNVCMQRIGVEDVFEKICSVYEQRRSGLRVLQS